MMSLGGIEGISGLEISSNEDGWGPVSSSVLKGYEDVPFAHFDKKDKCNRHADFAQQYNTHSLSKPYQKYRRDAEVNAEFSYKHDVAEDLTFQLVDTSKTQTKSKYPAKRTWTANPTQTGGRGAAAQPGAAGRGGRGATRGGRDGGRGGRGGRGHLRRVDRMPSVDVQGTWDLVEEFDLSKLSKLAANPPKTTDLCWCGYVDEYDDSYDKITTRTAKVLRRFENKRFFSVPTTEDPIIDKYVLESEGNVFATDSVLAQLMAAPRSVYSWDIVIEKTNGMLFLSKRDNSTFDLLTVSETAYEPPVASDEIDEMNHPHKLSLEASMINQNFSQQILKDLRDDADNTIRKKFEPNPFFEEEEAGSLEPASTAYRYRKFVLGNITIVARCEVHGWLMKKGEEQMMTCYALNEWDSRLSGGVNWRQKIDQQKGAVLATELKNNSCKLAKWTAQSILSGADQMKIGYVSRTANGNPYDHVVLGTQFFEPKALATQIALNINTMWGIVKMLCELLMNQPDGKFVLLKDPNKSSMRLYAVPLSTFEEDEEEEELEGVAAEEEADANEAE